MAALLGLVERGDPGSPLRWTIKSPRIFAEQLTRGGHLVSAWTVANLLREQGSACRVMPSRSRAALCVNIDRDAQFGYLTAQSGAHIGDGLAALQPNAGTTPSHGLMHSRRTG